MRPRQVNFLRHGITSRQALSILLDCWSENRSLPVILITPKAEASFYARRIRVTLAKEKGHTARKDRVAYGFTLSTPFPYSDGHVKGEAIILRFRLTPTQNLRNLRDTLLEGTTNGY